MVNVNRQMLFAFLSAGAIWITGISLGFRVASLPLILSVAAYLVFGSLALAVRRGEAGSTIGFLWIIAVVVLWGVVSVGEVGFWAGLYVSLVFGTLLFGAWIGTGFLLLHAFAGGKATTAT